MTVQIFLSFSDLPLFAEARFCRLPPLQQRKQLVVAAEALVLSRFQAEVVCCGGGGGGGNDEPAEEELTGRELEC